MTMRAGPIGPARRACAALIGQAGIAEVVIGR